MLIQSLKPLLLVAILLLLAGCGIPSMKLTPPPARPKPLSPAELAKLVEKYQTHSQPAYRLKAEPVDDSKLALGASRLGGVPDLPEGFVWPEWKGVSLAFIAQINLSEVAAAAPSSLLPANGVLTFFYDAEQEACGSSEDRGSWQVFYHAELPLRRTALPEKLPVDGRFASCRLVVSPVRSFPQPGTQAAAQAKVAVKDAGYEEFYDQWQMAHQTGHQLLGFPDIIQNEMELDCQLASNGIDRHDDPRRKGLEPAAADWILLLQVDSDKSAKMMWGDAGCLYFWIRKQDLARKDFQKTWMIGQCY